MLNKVRVYEKNNHVNFYTPTRTEISTHTCKSNTEKASEGETYLIRKNEPQKTECKHQACTIYSQERISVVLFLRCVQLKSLAHRKNLVEEQNLDFGFLTIVK